ncbi:MAG: class I SAM-dependent methyltransferase [Bacteroidetes bacterium]|nr:class I SAM-dependent methyltransferase [Bacteroidota bacterium]
MKNTNCIICQKNEFKIVGKPRINKRFPRIEESNYTILKCKNCGYYFVSPQIDLSQEEWKDLYESDYFEASQKTQWQIDLNSKELKDRIGVISENLNIEKGNFLDMGCGEGFMLKEAEINGFKPFGLDIAHNLNPEFSEKYDFFKGSIFDAKFPDNFFSVVYMDSVLEHVTNPVETIAELKRILKPGGIMLVIVPNEDSTMNTVAKWTYFLTLNYSKYGKIKPFVTPYHIQGYNKKSLNSLFDRLDLEVIDIVGFGGNYKFWKSQTPFSKQYFVSLFTYPFGLWSVLFDKQIQLMSLLRK